MNEWRIVFWSAFVIFALTSIIYGIWASGELQPWNNLEKQPHEEHGGIDKASTDRTDEVDKSKDNTSKTDLKFK